MTVRDELATELHRSCGCSEWHPGDPDDDQYDRMAERLIEQRWRKIPSREQIVAHLAGLNFHWSEPWEGEVLDAILDLMGAEPEVNDFKTTSREGN